MLKLNSDWNEKENIMAVLNNVIEKHRKTFDVENPRDFTDQLIINELQKSEGKSVNLGKDYCLESISNTILDLLLAGVGSESISATLTWTFLQMIQYPEIEKKVHQEIEQVVGRDRLPSIEDRLSLPYTEAKYF